MAFPFLLKHSIQIVFVRFIRRFCGLRLLRLLRLLFRLFDVSLLIDIVLGYQSENQNKERFIGRSVLQGVSESVRALAR